MTFPRYSYRAPLLNVAMGRGIIILGALTAIAAAPTAQAAAAKPYDVNGDGRQDLIVGLPGWLVDDTSQEVGFLAALGSRRNMLGRVVVRRRERLDEPPSDDPGQIGTIVTSADFDGDGRADIALAAPFVGEREPDFSIRSSVLLAYGARRFPGDRTAHLLEPAGRGPTPFGDALVAGDLNGDDSRDLVVGPGFPLVYEGTPEGLAETPAREIAPPEGAEGPYGHLLALGDVTRDGRGDLLVAQSGFPRDDEEDQPAEPGHISAAFGGNGPTAWVAREVDGVIASLAVGDVDGDRYNDLVTGLPAAWDENDVSLPGSIRIWWGSPSGFSSSPTIITQGSPGVPGTDERADAFGQRVAVGRLDGDRYADIVVGAPSENRPCGRVTIIRGGPAGYSRKGNRSFGFGSRGVPGECRAGQDLLRAKNLFFGGDFTLLDFNGDRRLDLALADRGIPQSNAASRRTSGVTVLRGTKRGISLRGARRLNFAANGVVQGDQASTPVLGRAGSSN